jgi:hypothetical protein
MPTYAPGMNLSFTYTIASRAEMRMVTDMPGVKSEGNWKYKNGIITLCCYFLFFFFRKLGRVFSFSELITSSQ